MTRQLFLRNASRAPRYSGSRQLRLRYLSELSQYPNDYYSILAINSDRRFVR